MSLKHLLILSSLVLSSAFFQIFKSATPEVHTQDNNPIRGVPEYLHSKYLEETFVCDGGHTRISKSNINDNYCDCADKSDEPGTSACGALNSFHCINKGFKMVILPGSRVDDHICDCCDGSDEAYGLCANTCDAAAAKERAALEGATTAYRIGSALRASLIQAVIKEKNELADKLPTFAAEVDRTRGLISSVKASIDWAKIKANEAKESALVSANQMIDGLLNVKEFNARAFANLLSKVVATSNLSQGDVNGLVGGPASASTTTNTASNHDRHDDEEEVDDDLHHHHRHDDDHYQDGYGDDSLGHNHAHEEPVESAAAAAASVEDAASIPRCDVVSHSGDDRLLPVCRSEDPLAAAHQLLTSLLKDSSRHAAYMLLTGHFKLHNTFDAAEEFVAGQLEAVKQGACPAAFESIREHCSLAFKLTEAFENYNRLNDDHEDGEELKQLRRELGELEDKLRSQESEKRGAEQAGRDLQDHKEQLELLALKDQCFDVSDGKFTYSVCVMGRISQKENEGNHNTVTLGEYSSRENNSKDASLTLHYTNGQHCHAHGARKADVKVVCGPAHALKSASEPSTCFYDLLFESPIACTPEFAALNGINA